MYFGINQKQKIVKQKKWTNLELSTYKNLFLLHHHLIDCISELFRFLKSIYYHFFSCAHHANKHHAIWQFPYTINTVDESVFLIFLSGVIHMELWATNFKSTQFGAHGVMVIVIENGHGDMSSNPGWDWIHFI